MNYLQKACNFLKILSTSLKSNYANEHFSGIRMNITLSVFSDSLNYGYYLMTMIENAQYCTLYVWNIYISTVLIYTLCGY